MNNKEKKEYIKALTEFNVKCYMNGEKDNFIGKMAFEFGLTMLKLRLMFKRDSKISYRLFTNYPIND